MRKITEQEMQDYVAEVGEFEKEHRKYASFFATACLLFKEEHIEELKEEGLDASQLLGVGVILSGVRDDSNGAEWESVSYERVEQWEELVPEQIIPAHYVTKEKTSPFKPDWS